MNDFTRNIRLVLVAAAIMGASMTGCGRQEGNPPGKPPVADKDDSPEMKWAVEIAEAFLFDVSAAKWDSAKQKVIKARREPGPGGLVSSDISHAMGEQGAGAAIITSKAMSPAKDEASFRGTMAAKEATIAFILKVQVDPVDEKWRVSEFTTKFGP